MHELDPKSDVDRTNKSLFLIDNIDLEGSGKLFKESFSNYSKK